MAYDYVFEDVLGYDAIGISKNWGFAKELTANEVILINAMWPQTLIGGLESRNTILEPNNWKNVQVMMITKLKTWIEFS